MTNLVLRHNVFLMNTNSVLVSKTRQDLEASMELNFTETECKKIIASSNEIIKKLESIMPPVMILMHRKINVASLFSS